MSDTIIVTPHSSFYRAKSGDETRYFPCTNTNGKNKANAKAFDDGGDPPIVMGFAVFDTAIATAYAVEIYPTAEQAATHTPSTPAPPPADVYDEPTASTDETPEAETVEADTKPDRSQRGKKRGRK